MNWCYPFYLSIDLYVVGRILKEDAHRQKQTAKAILERLKGQPGVILADEVGMGKTFVSLAVAASVALQDVKKRPVVIMVPSSLKEKWPKDLEVFSERCLPNGINLRQGTAESTVQLLKLIDSPEHKRANIIFLTHGALNRSLGDGLVKLAFIQRALYRRKNVDVVYKALYKYAGSILQMSYLEKRCSDIWKLLLDNDTSQWHKILIKYVDWNDGDLEPVPLGIVKIIQSMKSRHFQPLLEAVGKIPLKHSLHIQTYLKNARYQINQSIQELWKLSIQQFNQTLPLLILDEAHHLKNGKTRLAGLFQTEESQEDAESVSKGALAQVFEKMLFLTATPFQLGHHELCNVLERFSGVYWNGASLSDQVYLKEISHLRTLLDKSQEAAIRFDRVWGQLTEKDIFIDRAFFNCIETWWTALIKADKAVLSPIQAILLDRYCQVFEKMKDAEGLLKKYVIRHLKQKILNGQYKGISRRESIPGKGISNNDIYNSEGLSISQDTAFPFLLSVRLASLNPEARPVFSEGLSSSYEAFLTTRKNSKEDIVDQDSDLFVGAPKADYISEWYVLEIDRHIRNLSEKKCSNHPKVKATVDKVTELWMKGEKVIVFCHYIATGKALRQYISDAIREKILEKGAEKLKCPTEKVWDEFDRIGKHFENERYKIRKVFDETIFSLMKGYVELRPYQREIADIIRRYVKTPSFLIRYFPLQEHEQNEISILQSFKTKDASGRTLLDVIKDFFAFLSNQCAEKERERFINALLRIQPGGIRSHEVHSFFAEEEGVDRTTEILLPNVRLVNGATKPETRQNLMLTFNTPFYPDILIASSVMAEGVDLHLNCRHIIHHDLCWNPSTLEQRTGRVDRIGAKVEKCGHPIRVYLPYIGYMQDEKMYKVVIDRERWFNILMGEKYETDYISTEKRADRILLPASISNGLSFKLSVA